MEERASAQLCLGRDERRRGSSKLALAFWRMPAKVRYSPPPRTGFLQGFWLPALAPTLFYQVPPPQQPESPAQISSAAEQSSTQSPAAGGRGAAISKGGGRISCAGRSLLLRLYLALSSKVALHVREMRSHRHNPTPKDWKNRSAYLLALKKAENQTRRRRGAARLPGS